MGAVTAAIIGASAAIYSSNKSSKSTKRLSKTAEKSAQENLDFANEQYEDWKMVYGDLEQNLADYYNKLTPETRIAQGLEAFELEKDRALTSIRETLEQRGIGGGGVKAQLETDVALNSAEEKARIRLASPREVAAEQMSFLQLGLQRNPASNVQQVLTNRSNQTGTIAMNAAQAASGGRAAVVDAVGNLIETAGSELFKDRTTPAPIEESTPITVGGE